MTDLATQDSGTVAPVSTGADVSPDVSAVQPAVVQDATPAAPSGPEAEFQKHLESLDPKALPEPLRRKLELPFLSDYTRKTQQLAEERARLTDERARIVDAFASRLNDQITGPAPDEKTVLLERVKQGDLDALIPLMNAATNERVQPYVAQQAMRTAVEQAEAMHPLVREKSAEIAQVLSQNPQLRKMAQENNFANAPYVMAGIATQLEAQGLRDRAAQTEKIIAERETRAVEAYKAKVAGIPTSTSRAGSTPSAAPASKSAETAREAAFNAWVSLGYNPDDFK